MTTTPESPLPSPRKLPAPSRRNLQIYLDYQVHGLCQTKLAEKYNLTQCRISQILRRIDAWRSQSEIPNSKSEIPNSSPESPAPSPESPSSAAAFDLQLQHHRLNLVAREAIRHFQTPQATVTHKQGTRGDKSIDETTTRSLPKNLQCLKIILQANNQQQRLSRATSTSPSRHSPSDSPSDSPSSQSAISNPQSEISPLTRETVTTWLADQHHQAEKDKKVFFSGKSVHLAKDLLKLLLGEPHTGLAVRLLAALDGKKVVDYSPRDFKAPRVPPYTGWYYAMYDAHGVVVAYLHADQVAHLLPPDYPPSTAISGGLPRSHCPPLKILNAPAATIASAPAASELLPLPLGEGRGEAAWPAPTSSTSSPATESTQPQSPQPLTSLSPPITILPPLITT